MKYRFDFKVALLSIAVVAAACAVLYTGAFGGGSMFGKKKSFGKLVEYRFSKSGDMLGSLHHITFKRLDGFVDIVEEKSSDHSSPLVKTTFRAPEKALDEIQAVFERRGMRSWRTDRLSKFIACDAPTYSYWFVFEDPAGSVDLSSTMDLPDKSWVAFGDISKIEHSYMTEEYKVK